jgi:tetratricopeptide (TPR) repeat protein
VACIRPTCAWTPPPPRPSCSSSWRSATFRSQARTRKRRAVREANYNLARVYLDSCRPKEALPLLEDLAKASDEARFRQHQAQCHYMLGQREEAKRILEDLIANPPKPPELPERPQQPDASAEPAAAENGAGPVEHTAEASDSARPAPWTEWLMGVIHFEEGKTEEALACLLRAQQADPRLPNLHLRIGEAYLRRQQLEDGERAFRRALEIDGDSAEAHLGLAQVHLRRRCNEDAAEEALLAVGLQHFLPLGHYYLGVALARLGHPHRATLAFETSVSMLPGLVNGHRWLAALYGQPGGDVARSASHRRLAGDLLRRRQQKAAQ